MINALKQEDAIECLKQKIYFLIKRNFQIGKPCIEMFGRNRKAQDIWRGSKFVGRGYGKQILLCLIRYCKEEFGAKEFIYSTRDSNKASIGLALSLGFQLIGTEEKQDKRDNQIYILQKYSLKI